MAFSTSALGEWAAGLTAGQVAGGVGVAAAGLGAVSSIAAMGKKPVIPPSPVIGQATVDQSEEQVEQNAMRRESIAGGIQSTIGPGQSQQGEMLNPANLSQKSLLGQ